jgi:thiol-disulfide isomerase/thioredoxin
MRIPLNRFTRILLLTLLVPIVVVKRAFRFLTGKKKPQYQNTIVADPLAYTGSRPIVISIWATWATVWNVTAEKIVVELQKEFSDRCEFAFVEASSREVVRLYGVKVVPTIILRQNGQDVERFVNMVDGAKLRTVLTRVCAA